MLQHMVKTQILNLVFRGVYLVIGVSKVRLDDESRRIAVFAGRRVVGAGIAAFC